jgi:cytochrome c553
VKQLAAILVVGVAILVVGAALRRAGVPWRTTASPAAAVEPAAEDADAAIALALWRPARVDRSKIDYTNQPLWAYGVTASPKPDQPQAIQGHPDDPRYIGARFEVVDQFPEDHPNPMPDIIRHGPAAFGRGKTNRPCGLCHRSDGSGQPENASPGGLPAEYMRRQLNDFRNDLRHSADPRKGNTNSMVMLAKAMTEEEMNEAIAYFSAVRPRPRLRVVETEQVPKNQIRGELFVATGEQGSEPIGNRILEMADNLDKDPGPNYSRRTWVAYVPVGAVEKGKELVTTGGMTIVNGQTVQGKTTACGACHGEDLRGDGSDLPTLTGRSPSYLARQMFDIQQGARRGSHHKLWLMRLAIERLTADDILNISAYLASLPLATPAAAR